jgi:hypothetical protein
MWNMKPALAMLVGAASAAALASAPIALAQECDPTATVCQGDVDTAPTAAPAPMVTADEQYPLDEDWYFNPAGGGTALQPNHPPGGGSAGGGGRR